MLPKMQRALFDKVGAATQDAGARGGPVLDLVLRRAARTDRPNADDWMGEADWARLQQEPLRARGLLWGVGVVLALLLLWAAFAELDEVTRGEGRVIPTSQLQVVQSVDGGVVEELAVREGQTVEPGQLLLRIDPTRFVSTLLESRATALALQAKAARLEALGRGSVFTVRRSSSARSPRSSPTSAGCTRPAARASRRRSRLPASS